MDFQSFEMDNITVRKPLRANSVDNIFNVSLRNNSTLHDTTMMSLPNTSLSDSDEIENYKDTIKRLTTELESAHQEIDNLNSENFRLKMDIGQYQKVIETYKKVNILETKCVTPKSTRKRNIIRTSSISTPSKLILPLTTAHQSVMAIVAHSPSEAGNMSFNTAGSVCSLDGIHPTCPHTPYNDEENNGIEEQNVHHKSAKEATATGFTDQQTHSNSMKETDQVSVTKKYSRIVIFGDQQAYGLNKTMTNTRLNKWNNNYKITSFIKPQATSAQVLSSCNDDFVKTLTSDDIIVLVIGSNDKNPYSLITELCNVLYKLRNNTVFITNVQNNPYLNESTINYNLGLIIQNYKNCKYIKIHNFDYISSINDRSTKSYHQHYLSHLCLKLNTHIDYIKYKTEFLNRFKNKNKIQNRTHIHTTPRKTTQTKITAFFEKTKKIGTDNKIGFFRK
ncbi:hypothetical protein PYW08_010624 [Mythimna loreyi]|uniref:Uncharacterized protein n=1 Tax=Mythimna loreyi TaxID=667449 RepID=A0ACC2Q6B7_9NEOP|nr:hypothetical protein PYW08_010624 [Mythimna loreyi]